MGYLRGGELPEALDYTQLMSTARSLHDYLTIWYAAARGGGVWGGGGHLDVLKWLCSQDLPCPRDEKTCHAAARGSHLDMLQWARLEDPVCYFTTR